jgi:hypothetical protein
MALQGSSNDDRRRGDRHPINPEFAALDPGSLTYASNLSEYGVFLNTRVRLPVGTPVELKFSVLLDDPVVISGAGRVVHHQDEPRGMGVVFAGLSAEMHLRVIDAINWYRARALSGADRVFRTRELTPDELEQIEEKPTPATRSPASAPAMSCPRAARTPASAPPASRPSTTSVEPSGSGPPAGCQGQISPAAQAARAQAARPAAAAQAGRVRGLLTRVRTAAARPTCGALQAAALLAIVNR